MKRQLSQFWESVKTSFGFLPSLMLLGTIALQRVLLGVDERSQEWVRGLSWVYRGGPEGALELLTTLIGAIITVTGVIFSVTIVSLTLVSQQLGPRLLRQFRNNKRIQIVLGTFVSTFLFCLLVLWTFQPFEDGTVDVPRLSITTAALMSVGSFLMLIYFIHHIAKMIQADHLIVDVEGDLRYAIEHFYQESDGSGPADDGRDPAKEVPADLEKQSAPVHAPCSGYIQAISHQPILELASKNDLLIRLNYRAGQFVSEGDVLALVWPRERCEKRQLRQLAEAHGIGAARTPTQDVEFAVNQLVEVALRALSSGMNDEFTAIAAVDYLGAALRRCAALPSPSAYREDGEGRLRLITRPVTFGGLMATALDQIRQSAAVNVAVSIRLLEMLEAVMSHARGPAHGQVVLQHARRVRAAILAHTEEPADRADVEERYAEVERRLVELGSESVEASAQ